MNAKIPVQLLVPTVLILAAASCLQAQSGPLRLSGEIRGATGRHTVHVALWDSSGFLQKPVQELKFAAGERASFQFRVVPGEWAVSAYEDTNENSVLDMGMFGPKEPSGFWRAFHQWRKPRFADVSSRVDKDTAGADIELHK